MFSVTSTRIIPLRSSVPHQRNTQVLNFLCLRGVLQNVMPESESLQERRRTRTHKEINKNTVPPACLNMLEFDPATELKCRVVFIFIWKLELLLPMLHRKYYRWPGLPTSACVTEEIYPQIKHIGTTIGHLKKYFHKTFFFLLHKRTKQGARCFSTLNIRVGDALASKEY